MVVVVGYQADQVRSTLTRSFDEDERARLRFALQAEQHGTGHAVLCGLPELPEQEAVVWILSGDVPLIEVDSLMALRDGCIRSDAGLALAIFEPDDLTGYGRILRDEQGRVTGIREERDATPAERAVRECNAGIYAVRASLLREVVPTLGRDNDQGEMYLTDLVERAAQRGVVSSLDIAAREAAGVNTPEQLRALEQIARG